MAATILTVTGIPHTGLDLDGAYVTPTDLASHKAPTGEGIALIVANTSGGTTVTLYTPNTVDGLAIADRTVTVTAAHTEMIPLPRDVYGDPADSYRAKFDISGTAGNNKLACVQVG